MTIHPKEWANDDLTIRRIYLGSGYIEIRHIGARGAGWADRVETSSHADDATLVAFAAAVGKPEATVGQLFEAFHGMTVGYMNEGKKAIKAKQLAARNFTFEVAA